jgi:hypothetical protein
MQDSGLSNPTPDGTYLVSSDDWDQDGVSNLTELLVNHTNPRVPNSTGGDSTTTVPDTTTTVPDTTTTVPDTTTTTPDTTTTTPDTTTTIPDTTFTPDVTIIPDTTTTTNYVCTCGGNHASAADCPIDSDGDGIPDDQEEDESECVFDGTP